MTDELELSIVMPCLDEAETLATCIAKAQGYLARSGIRGEVVIGDNGSTDGSQDIARSAGAIVVDVPRRGYGEALLGAIATARGTYVIQGDADDSYDFSALDPFVAALRGGCDMVIGNRFRGGIQPGAMPALHKLGVPALSLLGRALFGAPVGDFHCGLRGYRRDLIERLVFATPGMEFASAMIIEAHLAGARICEVPTTLAPDGRSRPGHLRTWRDGWRHLQYLVTTRWQARGQLRAR